MLDENPKIVPRSIETDGRKGRMAVKVKVSPRVREKFLSEILAIRSSSELSGGRAAETLGLRSVALYQLLAERDKFEESVQREFKSLAGRK